MSELTGKTIVCVKWLSSLFEQIDMYFREINEKKPT